MLKLSIPRIVEKRKAVVSTTSGIGKFVAAYNLYMGRPRKAGAAATRDPMAIKIGARIREARESKKWFIKDLALHSGLGLTRVGNYETGERMPGPADILAMAKALGESAPWLMCLVDDKNPDTARNSTETALLEMFRIVDPPYRERALNMLGAIAFLKKEGIPDSELEFLSAKGKKLTFRQDDSFESVTGALPPAKSKHKKSP